ncbi:sensor histidine kinase [Mucilaginibacter sp.]|uniref:sensor histidine kinase n=1 Tax=Mucilaginibacter sp. TaxID=1882438 RepID=UPI0035BC53AA
MAQLRLPINTDIRYLNSIGLTTGGLVVTSAFRYYLKRRGHNFKLNPLRFVGSLLAATVLQALGWLVIFVLMFLPLSAKYPVPYLELLVNIVPLMVLLLVWNLIYLSYHLIRRYHITEIEKWKLEAEVQKANLGVLKAQINPHFLFNSLNNIRALILEDPNLAREMLTRFSELFRYALQHGDKKEVTMTEELQVLTQFVDLLKVQYEDKLLFELNVDPNALPEMVPPMILQLLVENAVKHGIAVVPGGGKIGVRISRSDRELDIIVTNTGTLLQKNDLEDSLGIGLPNIKNRLELLYGLSASLSIREEADMVYVNINIKK